MIDGVKIEVPSLTAKHWLSNSLLNFHAYTNVNTGELLDTTIVAKYRGLVFSIITSTKYENKQYCRVRGSLHKFWNNGQHNYNDFTFRDLQNVINEFHQKFNIDPETAILKNVEFGVNIYTPVTTKQLLKDLVAYGAYTFGTLTVANKKVGKLISKQQAKLKIYDKGTQYKTGANNLTRIEIAIKKMQYLKKYNISTLADLLDIYKTKPLGALLLSYWNAIIYYDKKIAYKQLTDFERKKLLYYATPRNWSDYNRTQRTRAKKHFSKLIATYGSTTQRDISNLVSQKWTELTAQKCTQINHNTKEFLQQRNVHELTVSIEGKNVYKTPLKKNLPILPENSPKKQSKMKPKKRTCKMCKNDIIPKRKEAMYCSKKCNNKNNGIKRTKKRQSQKQQEKEDLKKLLYISPKNKLSLKVSYREGTEIYTDSLLQSEIRTTKGWIKKVVHLQATTNRKNAKTITLTSYRARAFIRQINTLNKIKER